MVEARANETKLGLRIAVTLRITVRITVQDYGLR
jgi:hypothetical protein